MLTPVQYRSQPLRSRCSSSKLQGLDKVRPCGACHSLDYVPMNSPFLTAQWDAEVAKMIGAFGAPIDQADAKIIADNLKKNYES